MNTATFRNYNSSELCLSSVEKTYRRMLQSQNIDYVNEITSYYFTCNPSSYNIWDAISMLDIIIDESDPDTDLPQIVHAFQTAESIRSNYICNNKLKSIPIKTLFTNNEWDRLPSLYKNIYSTTIDMLYPNIVNWDWFILVGFIHDLGKIMLLDNFGNLPQWAVVGDTFPLGNKLDPNYVYFEKKYQSSNIDLSANIYLNKCGFKNVIFSWGHDEYLAKTLEYGDNYLPPEAIYIIRYHSFYSWHTPSNGIRGYTHLANHYDWLMLPLLKCLQKADLYSKSNDIPDDLEIKHKYEPLIRKYFPLQKIGFFRKYF